MQSTAILNVKTEVCVFVLGNADVLQALEGDIVTKVIILHCKFSHTHRIMWCNYCLGFVMFVCAVTCDDGCWNGGECNAVNGVAKCICPSSWTGSKCQEGWCFFFFFWLVLFF